jgi:glycosyltransferase involved in cell wall biosynthesis
MHNQALNSLSIIVFTYNSFDLIEKTLEHLNAAIRYSNIEHEIILVDNNSTDNTIELVEHFAQMNSIEIKIIHNPKQGLSYSRIEGVKAASKEFICFIDDDNFISETWVETLKNIIVEYNPDVIGCRTIGISDIPFPSWWEKYQGVYACGTRFKESGFLKNPLNKMWGAGLTARTKYIKPALFLMDLLCTDRIGEKQMTGGDAELNYRMRLLGAKFYNSNELSLMHFMRAGRFTKKHLNNTREGNGLAGINLDVYKFLLTNKKRYKLFNLALLILFGALPLSIKYKSNYLKFALMRFKSLNQRLVIQENIKRIFIPIN